MMINQDVPAGLGEAGAGLWRQVVGEFDLAPDELALLLEACRTVDELEAMQSALAEGPLLVKGSTGQLRPSGLLAEVRAHRLALVKLLEQLALPDEGEEAGKSPAQLRASKAAEVRWSLERQRRGTA
ncbi:hypothetical protein ADK77_44145 [Streptomyces antibioticus]|nr:hypothetical protein [Streptomyces antibioticus]KOG58427.1 hypothetical protein ADK77_44145 [Streptomyces antibioticus]